MAAEKSKGVVILSGYVLPCDVAKGIATIPSSALPADFALTDKKPFMVDVAGESVLVSEATRDAKSIILKLG